MELIQLTLTVLGNPPNKIQWRAPGPVHHARWMAKLIYAIKIFLFRDQQNSFNLTQKDIRQLERFAFKYFTKTSLFIYILLYFLTSI